MRNLLVVLLSASLVAAEDGLNAWLRYAPLSCSKSSHPSLPQAIVALNTTKSSPVYTAGQELQKGLQGIFLKQVQVSEQPTKGPSVVVGSLAQYTQATGNKDVPALEEDGYWLNIKGHSVQIVGHNERGALYGAFEYLSMLARGNFSDVTKVSNPSAPIRWTNEWDNMDGSIERGYAGPSIFFANGGIVEDLTRVSQYARLLASIGINGVIVNNVNANQTLLAPQNIKGLGRIADAMRPYGVNIGISLNFASPQTFGGLKTFDPLDASVISFWNNITTQIYQQVPDFAGYLVKANSEGQPGPITYNRTLADGANLFANAIKPHGGIVMFRAFVYDQLNESNWRSDRADAAVDYFKPLDGKFDDNVVVQIKYGPIDFQVREPASPLFANIPNTNTAIELQITQEYLGQQCHLVYLPPLWKTVLDFDMQVSNQPSLVRDIVSGERFKRPLGGYAGVVNVGTNSTWLGSHLSMSNLYAYGRLAWDPTSDPQAILEAWTRLTFGQSPAVLSTITSMSMASWPAYENYTGNLGVQTLTDILYTHFGPNPQSMDNNGWGQWTRADKNGIGMDRTVSNGTGFAGQYPPAVAAQYESLDTTPDNLLLWFHHVPYTHPLKEGKTVIQHFYDAHYAGAATAQTFPTIWEGLKGKIDDQRYEETLFRLRYQAGHSLVWRDAINDFYHNVSGIPDAAGRVGHHPWRIEAESMAMEGYKVVDVTPFEMASNFRAAVTSSNTTAGTLSATVPSDSGRYDLAVNYYDVIGGRAKWEVFLGDRLVGSWRGDNEDKLGHAPSTMLDGHSATRVTFGGVEVKKGDVLKIVGSPDGIEAAPVDYVSFLPEGIVD
ncbi:alpha-glucuronidase A [Coniochaeta sp. 2T2.1]|nr:alpha-glucuronidase A [Coniochaeta sp. 2T2.1]